MSFKVQTVSASGAPDIDFHFAGDTCRAELAGAKLYAEAGRPDGGCDLRITDATGSARHVAALALAELGFTTAAVHAVFRVAYPGSYKEEAQIRRLTAAARTSWSQLHRKIRPVSLSYAANSGSSKRFDSQMVIS